MKVRTKSKQMKRRGSKTRLNANARKESMSNPSSPVKGIPIENAIQQQIDEKSSNGSSVHDKEPSPESTADLQKATTKLPNKLESSRQSSSSQFSEATEREKRHEHKSRRRKSHN